MSQGVSQKYFARIFETFDTGIAEEKYLIHRFKVHGMLTQALIERNARVAYVNEPLRISFYLRNPLRSEFEIE